MTHYKYNLALCKMEIDENTKTDDTNMEEYNRYMRLHAIVEEIKSGSVTRSPAWYTEHNHLLCLYDSHFKSGFSDLHPDITELKFRKNCQTLDLLINKLMREFTQYSWFSLYDYLQFNLIAIEVIDQAHDYLGETDEEDEFAQMFSSMKV